VLALGVIVPLVVAALVPAADGVMVPEALVELVAAAAGVAVSAEVFGAPPAAPPAAPTPGAPPVAPEVVPGAGVGKMPSPELVAPGPRISRSIGAVPTAKLPRRLRVPTLRIDRLFDPLLVTNAREPSGAIATCDGFVPTWMVETCDLVSRSKITTEFGTFVLVLVVVVAPAAGVVAAEVVAAADGVIVPAALAVVAALGVVVPAAVPAALVVAALGVIVVAAVVPPFATAPGVEVPAAVAPAALAAGVIVPAAVVVPAALGVIVPAALAVVAALGVVVPAAVVAPLVALVVDDDGAGTMNA
jgi:hypothetical protein